MWSEVINILLNGMDPARFIAMGLAMGGGALVFFTLDVRHSVRNNTGPLKKFNFAFMLRDNVARILGVVILIAATVILYKDLFGVSINIKLAFQAGLGIDALIGTLLKTGKESGPLKRRRDKLVNKYNAQ